MNLAHLGPEGKGLIKDLMGSCLKDKRTLKGSPLATFGTQLDNHGDSNACNGKNIHEKREPGKEERRKKSLYQKMPTNKCRSNDTVRKLSHLRIMEGC